MAGITDISELLRGLQPTIKPGRFVFVTTELDLEHHAAVIEAEGRTLIVEQQIADQAGVFYEGVFSWLTLQINSSVEAVGLTAAVSAALAEEGIACNVLAGFYHDHLLVPVDESCKAKLVLEELSRSVGAPNGG